MASSIKNQGFTLVEAMLSVAILLVMAVGGVAANKLATTGVVIDQLRSKANSLAVEGMEALMNARADNFLALSPGIYHPVFDGTKWTLVSGSEVIGVFTRSIKLSSVMRSLVCFDTVCEITPNGGIVDEGSLSAEVIVNWLQAGESKEIKLSSLITYWR